MPESTTPRPPRIDVLGFVLAVTGLCALSYGLVDAGETSWSNPIALPDVDERTWTQERRRQQLVLVHPVPDTAAVRLPSNVITMP